MMNCFNRLEYKGLLSHLNTMILSRLPWYHFNLGPSIMASRRAGSSSSDAIMPDGDGHDDAADGDWDESAAAEASSHMEEEVVRASGLITALVGWCNKLLGFDRAWFDLVWFHFSA